jgi:hypothetical protein
VKASDDVATVLLEKGRGHVRVERTVAITERCLARVLSVTFNDLVVRRNDLRPVTRVEFVPVVLGRIVTRRNHDAGRGAQRLHAVRHEWRR